MLESLTADSLVAEVIMSHDDGKVVVVVEGDLDAEFVESCISSDCEVVNARGKPRIVAVLERLLQDRTPIVIFMDRDFDFDFGYAVEHEDVVYSDRYNLEATLLLEEGVFTSLWSLHVPPKYRSDQFQADDALGVCKRISTSIGRLRYLSEKHKLALRLEGFPIVTLVNARTEHAGLDVQVSGVVELALQRSVNSPWLLEQKRIHGEKYLTEAKTFVMEKLRGVDSAPPADPVSGHDVAAVLNLILSRLRRSGVPSVGDIERHALVQYSNNQAGYGVTCTEQINSRIRRFAVEKEDGSRAQRDQ